MTKIEQPDIKALGDEIIDALGTDIAKPVPARIGNPVDFAIPVEGAKQAGLIWVHGLGDNPQAAEPALNEAIDAAHLVYNAPVKVKRDDAGLTIVSRDMQLWEQFFAGAVQHDQEPVYLSQIMYGTLLPTEPRSMKALVIGAMYTQGESSYFVSDQFTGDFSAGVLDVNGSAITIPTTNTRAKAVLVQVSAADGVLSYKVGSEFDAGLSHPAAFAAGYYPSRDTERFRIGYIRLVAGMSAVGYEHLWVVPEFISSGFDVDSIVTSVGHVVIDGDGKVVTA